MKNIFLLLIISGFISSCQNKKLDSVQTEDSVATDTVAQTTAVQLAFSPLDNYELKSNVKFPDSVTFLIVANQEEFDNLFTAAKVGKNEIVTPDFIINHTIAIATQPTDIKTLIEVEKVELGESTINVFTRITKGDKGVLVTPAHAFSVEKRDGVTGMDFYLNGKVVSSLMLPSF